MSFRIRVRRDTAAGWAALSTDRRLGLGELGWNTTTGEIRIGGVTTAPFAACDLVTIVGDHVTEADLAALLTADTALSDRLSTIEALGPLATDAELATVASALTAEASARQSAATALSTSITAEMERATAAEATTEERVGAVVAWLGLLTQMFEGT